MTDNVRWLLEVRGKGIELPANSALIQYVCPVFSDRGSMFAVQFDKQKLLEHSVRRDSASLTQVQTRFGVEAAFYDVFPISSFKSVVVFDAAAEKLLAGLKRSPRVLFRILNESYQFSTYEFTIPKDADAQLKPMMTECGIGAKKS